MGSSRTDGLIPRTYRAPAPLGPCILWADMDSRSMFMASTSIGMWPAACAASVCRMMPLCRVISPMLEISAMVPISLLASITDTATVSGVMDLCRSSSGMRPVLSTGR